MNANFHSVPFLHLDSPECQSGNDTTHGGQVFSLGLIKITLHRHNQTPFIQVILESANLTTPITLGCAQSVPTQGGIRPLHARVLSCTVP